MNSILVSPSVSVFAILDYPIAAGRYRRPQVVFDQFPVAEASSDDRTGNVSETESLSVVVRMPLRQDDVLEISRIEAQLPNIAEQIVQVFLIAEQRIDQDEAIVGHQQPTGDVFDSHEVQIIEDFKRLTNLAFVRK